MKNAIYIFPACYGMRQILNGCVEFLHIRFTISKNILYSDIVVVNQNLISSIVIMMACIGFFFIMDIGDRKESACVYKIE